MSALIRPFCLEDVAELVEMERTIFSVPWSEQQFIDLLKRDYCLYMVAQKEEKIVAFAGLTILVDEGDVDKVMVAESCRGQGIAEKMMQELLTEARRRGVKEFTLEVRVGNTPAIRLYEKLGFVSEGIRPRFYDKPVEDAMIMWLRQ
ncbi:MAG: ribosomal-protein-alanine N-acetyltransferase [Lachnospiraceae bacterium]|nr:ribosomal-protein-alanine N-acetyltransferase [Lachnospiraceae bacterium]